MDVKAKDRVNPAQGSNVDDVWVNSACSQCYSACGIKVHRVDGTVVKIEGQSLADYALGGKTVVNQEMAGTKGSIMLNMARKDIRSSMHVPVTIGGVPGTVNFWSAEPGAFPPQAVQLLEEVARLMAGGTSVARN